MRIALFGGSFDPPHLGHLAIARAAADAFALDQVLFAPAARQPLKDGHHAATYGQRLAMVELACTQAPRFHPSTLDAPQPGNAPSYTADTLVRLRAQHPEAELFNLAGADSFQHLAQWHHAHRLLDLADWIVVSRPGIPLSYPAGLPVSPAQKTRIHFLDSVHEDVSATQLRQRLATGDPCTDLLPPGVPPYIEKNGLYLLEDSSKQDNSK